MTPVRLSRRQMLQRTGALGLLAAIEHLLPPYARGNVLDADPHRSALPALSGDVIDLTIADTPFRVGDRTATAKTINGTVPGPVIRLKEGREVTLNVTNRLKERSSIHWHGVLVPPEMDGVPGVNFAGIEPGETFVYKFRLKQYGTYWYHSHSPGQEQAGVYAPMIIDPIQPDPVAYDRENVVVLSDWSFQSEDTMIGRLKKQAGYFNFQQRTMGEFLSDLRTYGWAPTMDNYLLWARMRMDPTDFADVTGHAYTYLMNGLAPTWPLSKGRQHCDPGRQATTRRRIRVAIRVHEYPSLKRFSTLVSSRNSAPDCFTNGDLEDSSWRNHSILFDR